MRGSADDCAAVTAVCCDTFLAGRSISSTNSELAESVLSVAGCRHTRWVASVDAACIAICCAAWQRLAVIEVAAEAELAGRWLGWFCLVAGRAHYWTRFECWSFSLQQPQYKISCYQRTAATATGSPLALERQSPLVVLHPTSDQLSALVRSASPAAQQAASLCYRCTAAPQLPIVRPFV